MKAAENVKILMKKGVKQHMDGIQFCVLDSRKVPHGTELDVEITKENDEVYLF